MHSEYHRCHGQGETDPVWYSTKVLGYRRKRDGEAGWSANRTGLG